MASAIYAKKIDIEDTLKGLKKRRFGGNTPIYYPVSIDDLLAKAKSLETDDVGLETMDVYFRCPETKMKSFCLWAYPKTENEGGAQSLTVSAESSYITMSEVERICAGGDASLVVEGADESGQIIGGDTIKLLLRVPIPHGQFLKLVEEKKITELGE